MLELSGVLGGALSRASNSAMRAPKASICACCARVSAIRSSFEKARSASRFIQTVNRIRRYPSGGTGRPQAQVNNRRGEQLQRSTRSQVGFEGADQRRAGRAWLGGRRVPPPGGGRAERVLGGAAKR